MNLQPASAPRTERRSANMRGPSGIATAHFGPFCAFCVATHFLEGLEGRIKVPVGGDKAREPGGVGVKAPPGTSEASIRAVAVGTDDYRRTK